MFLQSYLHSSVCPVSFLLVLHFTHAFSRQKKKQEMHLGLPPTPKKYQKTFRKTKYCRRGTQTHA